MLSKGSKERRSWKFDSTMSEVLGTNSVPSKLTKRQALTFLDGLLSNFQDLSDAEDSILQLYSTKFNLPEIDREVYSSHIAKLKDCKEELTFLKAAATELLESNDDDKNDTDEETTDHDNDSQLRNFAKIEPATKKARKERKEPTVVTVKDLVEEIKGQAITTKKTLAPQLKVRTEIAEEYKALCLERFVAMRKQTSPAIAASTWRIEFSDFLNVHGLQPRVPAFRTEIFKLREEVASWLLFAPDDAKLKAEKEAWFLGFSLISRILLVFAKMTGGVKTSETLEKKLKFSWATGYIDITDLATAAIQTSSMTKKEPQQRLFSSRALGSAGPRVAKDNPPPNQPQLPPRTCRFCGAQVLGTFRNHKCANA